MRIEEFGKEYANYFTILSAIARGENTRAKIEAVVKRNNPLNDSIKAKELFDDEITAGADPKEVLSSRNSSLRESTWFN